MKSELKIKFLQYLNNRCDRENGFIWIILLILAIAFGLLTFIMLPKFLGYREGKTLHCCRVSEGANNVAAMNYAQQELYLKKKKFRDDLSQLQGKFRSKIENYKYEIIVMPRDQPKVVKHLATPTIDDEKAYLGIVRTTIMNDDIVTIAMTCESKQPTGKNPIWQGLPSQESEVKMNCSGITVGGQPLVDSGLLSFSRIGEQENTKDREKGQ